MRLLGGTLLAIVMVSFGLASACSGGTANPTTSTTSNSQSSSGSTSPTASTLSQTDCGIVPPQYCHLGQIVLVSDPSKQVTYTNVGFNLPAGVPIFAPYDGSTTNIPFSLSGANVTAFAIIRADSKAVFEIDGDFTLQTPPATTFKKGDVVAYTRNTGVQLQGSNSLLVSFLGGVDQAGALDEQEMTDRFPSLSSSIDLNYPKLLTAFTTAAGLLQDQSLPGSPQFTKVDGCADLAIGSGLSAPCNCSKIASAGSVANCSVQYPSGPDVPPMSYGVRYVFVGVQVFADLQGADASLADKNFQQPNGITSRGAVKIDSPVLGDLTVAYDGENAGGADPTSCKQLYMYTRVGVEVMSLRLMYCRSESPIGSVAPLMQILVDKLGGVYR